MLRLVVVELMAAGVPLLQYRNKVGSDAEILSDCAVLRAVVTGVGGAGGCLLILNDRADLVAAAGFGGVHVGQGDMRAAEARALIGPDRILGVSTHTEGQVRDAGRTSADYIAIGPVFATTTKENPDPVVGLDGVRRARALTNKPLVAIGGITRANAASVIEAGADSVAVISDLLREPRKSAEEFFRILR